jgi:hypothetical protein
VLKAFYTIIKAQDEHIRFVLLTGISKFSRVGIFSGLNNLEDLSLRASCASLLGLTETEIKSNLTGYIEQFAKQQNMTPGQLLQKIRHWYNGFCFAADSESVYNPFSTLLLFKEQRFTNYWFETGTPTFLINLIKQRDYDVRQLERLEVEEMAFSTYDLARLQLLPLLFQTGYLTIKGYDPDTQLYRLSYPNYEVEHAFLQYLLEAFSQAGDGFNGSYLQRLIDALKTTDLNAFFETLKIFLAQIPYDLQIRHEKYYQTVFYLLFALVNLRIDVEKRTQRGRIDTVVELSDRIYLFEFKLDGSAQTALEQIKEKGYAEGYYGRSKTLYLIGVNFDSKQRSVSEWLTETVTPGGH